MAKPQYGYQHQRERADWNDTLTRLGSWTCRRCGLPVYPDHLAHLNRDGAPFDLGHPEPGQAGKEPEHAKACNRAAGGREGQRRLRMPASEEWW